MKTITVTTGFGYFTDESGHITAKAELPAGDHPMDPRHTYTEVTDAEDLAAIEVWQDPDEIINRENEAKVTAEIRRVAVETLIGKGDLMAGFE